MVLAGLVVTGAVTLLILGSRGDQGTGTDSRPRPGAKAPDESADSASVGGARPGPGPSPRRFAAQGQGESESGRRAMLEQFETEGTETAWADTQSRRIREVVASLVGDRAESDVAVTRVECRTTRCRLTVRGGDPQAFLTVIESMQDNRGFVGMAESLVLEGLRTEDDGTREVDVFLVFAR